MEKKKCYNIFYGILFCISISALVIACIAFTRNKDRDNYVDLLMVDNKPMKILVKGLYYYITKEHHYI